MPLATDPVEILQVKKLLHCVRYEDYTQIKRLVDKGVRQLINFSEPLEGETALLLAAAINNERMIEFLFEQGASANVSDRRGRTPLMRAAELGHVQALELIARHAADPLVKDIEGKDVLFYCLSAPTGRHDKCMQIVMSIGANVNNKTIDGLPIFVGACKEAQERQNLCLTLLEHGADPNAVDEVCL
jgi:ankyrin repeat protein